MFKSVFKKLLVTYLAIIIAVITTLSLILTVLYSGYVFNGKQESLVSAAFKVNQLVNSYSKKEITKTALDAALDSMGYVTDSKIYVVKVDKKSLEESSTVKLGDELEDSFLIKDLGKVLEGQTVFRQKQYSDRFDMYMVFAGVPWKTDKEIQGAILLFSPVSHVTSGAAKINLLIWLTALFFIFISAGVIYLNSLRISRPIKEMEKAATQLAAGNQTEDLRIDSEDEIGSLAKTFNFMKQQLQNTEKMRREFMANVSHELRTPLTSINGFVEGMMDGVVKPEEYDKYLCIIQQETKRLTRLTSDILQLAKIQSGSLKLDIDRLNAQDIISSVLDSTYVLLEEKSINLSVDCDASINVYADSDRLKQILINIVGNAVKYSGRGGEIYIQVSDVKTGTRFAVKDTGMGIPAEELPFIFEKFYRVDKSRQSSQGGTGLGLNIVKNLVELHGGGIWAESELGVGTQIIFELPERL